MYVELMNKTEKVQRENLDLKSKLDSQSLMSDETKSNYESKIVKLES